jgi:hypothetical protein
MAKYEDMVAAKQQSKALSLCQLLQINVSQLSAVVR